MGSVNKVILIGNVGKDVEMRSTPQGVPVARITLATNESWKDKDGNKQEKTEWHNIVAWDRLANLCGEYVSKGRQIYVEGSLQTRSWDDKDGNKKYMTEVKARNIVFLGSRDGGSGSGSGGGMRRGSATTTGAAGGAGAPGAIEDDFPPEADDDIPF